MESEREERPRSSRLPRNHPAVRQQQGCQRIQGPAVHYRYYVNVQSWPTHNVELRRLFLYPT